MDTLWTVASRHASKWGIFVSGFGVSHHPCFGVGYPNASKRINARPRARALMDDRVSPRLDPQVLSPSAFAGCTETAYRGPSPPLYLLYSMALGPNGTKYATQGGVVGGCVGDTHPQALKRGGQRDSLSPDSWDGAFSDIFYLRNWIRRLVKPDSSPGRLGPPAEWRYRANALRLVPLGTWWCLCERE